MRLLGLYTTADLTSADRGGFDEHFAQGTVIFSCFTNRDKQTAATYSML